MSTLTLDSRTDAFSPAGEDMTEESENRLKHMSILVVDDSPPFLQMVRDLLEMKGFTEIRMVYSGTAAIDVLESENIDLVLTDVVMPGMDGYQLLQYVKQSVNLRGIPVIMMSGKGEYAQVIRCIQAGAVDYLAKPLEQELLWARVHSSLERKYLLGLEEDLHREVTLEKEKSENVLYNVVPRRIAERLKAGERNIAENVNNATVLFTDMVKFTKLSNALSAERLVALLNVKFLLMDSLVNEYRLEKIKTVGDSYMVAAGLESGDEDHADRCVAFAKAAIEEMRIMNASYDVNIQIRVGIASGPLIAGVIGSVRPMYDVWGRTVNLASRMESHGMPEKVQIAESTYCQLANRNAFERRDIMEVKGIGKMQPFLSRD